MDLFVIPPEPTDLYVKLRGDEVDDEARCPLLAAAAAAALGQRADQRPQHLAVR